MKLHAKNIERGKSTGDQASFNEIYANKNQIEGLKDLKLAVLPMEWFPNGQAYFDNNMCNDDKYIVHNNYISGMDLKIQRFKDHEMWYLDTEDFNEVIRK